MPYQTHLAEMLSSSGVPFTTIPGWEQRGGVDFTPVAFMFHHTGGNSSWQAIMNDRSRGILANFFISREPRLYLLGGGRCAHAGIGLTSVWQAAAQESAPTGDARLPGLTSVNRYYLGVEVENDGVGGPYSDAQLHLVVALGAAICRGYSWTHNRCIHHRESTSRKKDMSWGAPGTKATVHHPAPYLRERVAAQLNVPSIPEPQPSGVKMTTLPCKWPPPKIGPNVAAGNRWRFYTHNDVAILSWNGAALGGDLPFGGSDTDANSGKIPRVKTFLPPGATERIIGVSYGIQPNGQDDVRFIFAYGNRGGTFGPYECV
jgi:hypothetical protein